MNSSLATTAGVQDVPGGRASFAGQNEQLNKHTFDGDDKNFTTSTSHSSNTHLNEYQVTGDPSTGTTESHTSTTSTSSSKMVSSKHQSSGHDDDFHRRAIIDTDSEQTQTSDTNTNTSKVFTPEAPSISPERHEHHLYDESNQDYFKTIQSNESRNKESKLNQTFLQAEELMSMPGQLMSRSIEYPDANTKVITEVKSLLDGTVVTTRKYETKASSSHDWKSSSKSATSSHTISENISESDHQRVDKKISSEDNSSRQVNQDDERTTSRKNQNEEFISHEQKDHRKSHLEHVQNKTSDTSHLEHRGESQTETTKRIPILQDYDDVDRVHRINHSIEIGHDDQPRKSVKKDLTQQTDSNKSVRDDHRTEIQINVQHQNIRNTTEKPDISVSRKTVINDPSHDVFARSLRSDSPIDRATKSMRSSTTSIRSTTTERQRRSPSRDTTFSENSRISSTTVTKSPTKRSSVSRSPDKATTRKDHTTSSKEHNVLKSTISTETIDMTSSDTRESTSNRRQDKSTSPNRFSSRTVDSTPANKPSRPIVRDSIIPSDKPLDKPEPHYMKPTISSITPLGSVEPRLPSVEHDESPRRSSVIRDSDKPDPHYMKPTISSSTPLGSAEPKQRVAQDEIPKRSSNIRPHTTDTSVISSNFDVESVETVMTNSITSAVSDIEYVNMLSTKQIIRGANTSETDDQETVFESQKVENIDQHDGAVYSIHTASTDESKPIHDENKQPIQPVKGSEIEINLTENAKQLKERPPFTRSETYEERCRLMLGMKSVTPDVGSDTVDFINTEQMTSDKSELFDVIQVDRKKSKPDNGEVSSSSKETSPVRRNSVKKSTETKKISNNEGSVPHNNSSSDRKSPAKQIRVVPKEDLKISSAEPILSPDSIRSKESNDISTSTTEANIVLASVPQGSNPGRKSPNKPIRIVSEHQTKSIRTEPISSPDTSPQRNTVKKIIRSEESNVRSVTEKNIILTTGHTSIKDLPKNRRSRSPESETESRSNQLSSVEIPPVREIPVKSKIIKKTQENVASKPCEKSSPESSPERKPKVATNLKQRRPCTPAASPERKPSVTDSQVRKPSLTENQIQKPHSKQAEPTKLEILEQATSVTSDREELSAQVNTTKESKVTKTFKKQPEPENEPQTYTSKVKKSPSIDRTNTKTLIKPSTITVLPKNSKNETLQQRTTSSANTIETKTARIIDTKSVRNTDTRKSSVEITLSPKPKSPIKNSATRKFQNFSDSEEEITAEPRRSLETNEIVAKVTRKAAITERKDSAPVYSSKKEKEQLPKMTRSSTSDGVLRLNQPQVQSSRSRPENTTSALPKPKSESKQRPTKCVTTKTINLTTANNIRSEENIIIDIQQAKSSREPTPNRIIPTPASPEEDTGKPRYPDTVVEPDEDLPKRKPLIKNIPIFEEESKEFISCQITEVEDDTVRADQFSSEIDEDHSENDDCMLSVSDKVSKFSAVSDTPVKKTIRTVDRSSITEIDETVSNVNEKINKFITTSEQSSSPKRDEPKQHLTRLDLDDLDESLVDDDCLLSVSDKVNKLTMTAKRISSSIMQKSPELVAKIERQVSKRDEGPQSLNIEVDNIRSPLVGRKNASPEEVISRTPTSTLERPSKIFSTQFSPTAPNQEEDVPQIKRTDSIRRNVADRYVPNKEKTPTSSDQSVTNDIMLRSTDAIRKARSVFQSIDAAVAPKQRDILSRPSVWDDRRSKQQEKDVKLTGKCSQNCKYDYFKTS